MNIIVAVHDSVSPIKGGGALRTVMCAVELKKRGHNVAVVAPSEKEELDGQLRCFRLPFIRKGQTGFAGLGVFVAEYVFAILRINRLWKKEYGKGVEMVFVHNAVLGFPSALLGFFMRFRFVLDITDLHSEYIKHTRRGFLESLALPFMRWAEYFSARRADRVIAVTETMKGMLVSEGKLNPAKIDVVYDGVDFEKFYPIARIREGAESSSAGGNIIYIGSMEETDGIDVFVKAIPVIAAASRGTKFIFVGGGGDFDGVVGKIREMGIYDRCVFTGWIEYEKVAGWMKEASIGLITRPPTPPNHTVITLKLLEYWASGVAVVSSRLKGIEEVASDGEDVIFFDGYSADELADKVLLLLKSPSVREKLAQNALSKVKRFDWRGLIEKIRDIVEKEGASFL